MLGGSRAPARPARADSALGAGAQPAPARPHSPARRVATERHRIVVTAAVRLLRDRDPGDHRKRRQRPRRGEHPARRRRGDALAQARERTARPRAAEALRGACVELGAEARLGGGALGAQLAGELGERLVLGRSARPRARRRGRRGRARPRGSGSLRHAASSQALLSFSTARCSRVPALDSLTPRTSAISALVRPAKNFSATSSRSRGGERRHRVAQRRPAQAASACSSGAGASSAGSVSSSAQAPAAPQLVERGVARDPEEPGAARAAPRVEARRLR